MTWRVAAVGQAAMDGPKEAAAERGFVALRTAAVVLQCLSVVQSSVRAEDFAWSVVNALAVDGGGSSSGVPKRLLLRGV